MRLTTLSLIGLFAAVAPAFAGTPASISGSATLVTPSQFTTTVSGESILPSGFAYITTPPTEGAAALVQPTLLPPPALPVNPNATLVGASVIVVPTYTVAGGATFVTNSLSVGSSVTPTVQAGTSFSATAAGILSLAASTLPGAVGTGAAGTYNSQNIDFISAIIRAGAGVNGLD
jgi:hypothetical protein